MAFDTFLEFPSPTSTVPGVGQIKVAGESADKTHTNTIQLASFTMGVENPTTIGSATGGAGGGKTVFHPLQVTKSVDNASAGLFLALGTGAHFTDMTMYVRKAGAPADYLIYKFKMVFVTNVSWAGASGDDQAQETVQFVYGAMQVSYAQQQPNGQLNKPNLAAWSQVTNKPELAVPTP